MVYFKNIADIFNPRKSVAKKYELANKNIIFYG